VGGSREWDWGLGVGERAFDGFFIDVEREDDGIGGGEFLLEEDEGIGEGGPIAEKGVVLINEGGDEESEGGRSGRGGRGGRDGMLVAKDEREEGVLEGGEVRGELVGVSGEGIALVDKFLAPGLI
jgi:hypothetical protein